MKYLYYPGCSLEGTAVEYNESTRALMSALGVELEELEDWTCCGATAVEGVSRLLSLALPARNLALAEKVNGSSDLLAPCSACYLNLKKVEVKSGEDPGLRQTVNEVLADVDLKYTGRVKVRHLLDVISRDIGAKTIAPLVKNRLDGLKVAPYYGCQCLRPYPVFDDPEAPDSMTAVLEASGVEVMSWHMAAKCCGASHMTTKPEIARELVRAILKDAKGADAIVTVCPMCQMNLEAFQNKISKHYFEHLYITVIYLPQLLGLALGLSEKEIRLDMNLAVTRDFKRKIGS